MDRQSEPIDWLRFAVHSFFGALVGAGLGFGFWIEVLRHDSLDPALPCWVCVVGGAVVIGLVAGLLGDKFWLRIFRR